MKYSLILLLIIFLFGCTTERKVTNYLQKHILYSANFCNTTYPVIPISTSETITQHSDTTQGKDQIISFNCDSLIQVLGVGQPAVAEIHCPDQKIITNTIYKDKTITIESTAKLAALRAQDSIAMQLYIDRAVADTKTIKDLQVNNDKVKHGRNTWRMIALVALAYLVIKTALRLMIPAISPLLKSLL